MYDGNGNQTRHTDGKGQVTTTQLDPFDRPYKTTYADGSSTQYSYDDAGRRTQIADSKSGTIKVDYDDYDHVKQVTTPYGIVKYQYDAAGRQQSLTYPSGLVVSSGYNEPTSQLHTLTVGGDATFTVDYEANGRIKTLTLPNGVNRSHSYNDPGDQLTAIAYTAAGAPLGDWTYAYDEAGRLKYSGGSLFTAVLPNTLSAGHDQADQIATFNGTVLASDANGSQVKDFSVTFAYDVLGRLTKAVAAGRTSTYIVNALGQRDTKNVASVVTHYLYDLAGHLIVETNASGKTQREYIWLGDMPVMVRVYNASVATEYYIYTDQLNTPRVITDMDNNPVWRWDSDPYGNGAANGNPRNVPGANFTFNLRFPGQYYDAETGLHYNGYRDYNPRTGRYIEPDPVGFAGGLNFYTYVGANPISFVDPRGLATQGDINLALRLIRNTAPELYTVNPTSVTPIRNLSTWYGQPLQGYTDLSNNIQINANLYGDINTPIDDFIVSGFIHTLAHEWLHVQQSIFEKALTHGELHDVIDQTGQQISDQIWMDFLKQRSSSCL